MSEHIGPRPDDRDRRSVEERRAQLVDAAAQVITTDGLGRATTRRITDHADLALGAFHYAFRSKDELLGAVIERFGDELDHMLRTAVHDPNAGFDGVVEQLATAFWAAVDNEPDHQLARHELMIHALRHPRLRQLAETQYGRYVRTISDTLSKVTEVGDQEAEELARFFLATMDGLMLQWLMHGEKASPEQRVSLTMRCLRSMVPDGHAPQQAP